MKSKKWSMPVIMASLALFYLAQPYFFWHSILSDLVVRVAMTFTVGFAFWLNRKSLNHYEFFLIIFLFVLTILYAFTSGRNIVYYLTLLPILFLPFSKEKFHVNVFNSFLTIYVIFIGLSLISHAFALMGIISPYTTIPPLNELKDYNYYVYPFLVRPSLSSLRFCGIFDEPGVVGTLSGIMLCIKGLNFRDYKSVILLISGLASLSLFFYILIAVYFALYSAILKRSTSRIVMYLLLISSFIYATNNVTVLSELIGERIVWDTEKGSLSGDNRINIDKAEYYISFISGNTKTLLFGIENKVLYKEDVAGSSSIFNVFIINGVVFLFSYILFFLLYAFRYKLNMVSWLMFTFVFIGTIYQRPYTFQFLPVFLFITLAKVSQLRIQDEQIIVKKNVYNGK